MTGNSDFRAALEKLGYSAERFAELFDIKAPSTVQNWRSGTIDAPGWAMAIAEYLLARPEARIWFEDRRPHVGAETKRRNEKRRGARAAGKANTA
jgi:hypothetical protein